MPSGTIFSAISCGGIAFTSNIVRSATGSLSHSVPIPAGVAGVLAAGTPPTSVTGLATPFVIGDLVDIHWTDPTDGVSHKCRRGVRVDAITPNTIITFDETPVALGDAYPTSGGVAVVVSKQVIVDTDWQGSLVEMSAIQSDQRMMADFFSSTVSILAQKLVAGAAVSWASNQGITDPFDSLLVDQVRVTNGTIVAGTFQVGIIYRSA